MYTDYWKANFQDTYKAVKETAKAGEALVIMADMADKPKSKAPWKEFKGNCMYCGKEGHKAVECHTKARLVAGQRVTAPRSLNRNNNGLHFEPHQGRGGQNHNFQRMETRHCNGFNKVGHLVRNCPNVARPPNQTINNAIVGHVELCDGKETKTYFSAPSNMGTSEWWTDAHSSRKILMNM
jgi:hypothetical protein